MTVSIHIFMTYLCLSWNKKRSKKLPAIDLIDDDITLNICLIYLDNINNLQIWIYLSKNYLLHS